MQNSLVQDTLSICLPVRPMPPLSPCMTGKGPEEKRTPAHKQPGHLRGFARALCCWAQVGLLLTSLDEHPAGSACHTGKSY